MIKLNDILKEVQGEPKFKEGNRVKYNLPRFELEWDEAARYPEFQEIGKDGWIKLAKRGHEANYSDIENVLGNVDLDFQSLDPNKIARFKSAYEKSTIEMPIAAKFPDGSYDLVAGNTRLSGLVNSGEDPKIWVVEVP